MLIKIRKTGEKQVLGHVKSKVPFTHTNRSQTGSWMSESGVGGDVWASDGNWGVNI